MRARFFPCSVGPLHLQRTIHQNAKLELVIVFPSLYRKCWSIVAFNLLLISIIRSMLCLDYACRFTICFISATQLKTLNRLIIDIISKCHPLWKQMLITAAISVRVLPSMWAAIKHSLYILIHALLKAHACEKTHSWLCFVHQPGR